MNLSASDNRYLIAAASWLDLGNLLQASAELENIDSGAWVHPDVLEIRYQIHAREPRWDACLDIATALVYLAPNRVNSWRDRSKALFKLGRVEEAAEKLKHAAVRFPNNWQVRCDLACYECQLNHPHESSDWLEGACALRELEKGKLTAFEDASLEIFWRKVGIDSDWLPESENPD